MSRQLPQGKAEPLSQTEAKDYRRTLDKALRFYLKWADEGIWAMGKQNKGLTDPPPGWAIWNDMDDDEINVLVSGWLGQAEKSVAAAMAVRQTVYIFERVRVGIVILPRVKKMAQFVMEQGGLSLPW